MSCLAIQFEISHDVINDPINVKHTPFDKTCVSVNYVYDKRLMQ